ncbi:MAG TPA: hypothetical protein VGO21_02385, partial [Candidatus Paceibacterota bacterium]|nr:hypothetical protein [Candidatus Paceibacterota bacterium]
MDDTINSLEIKIETAKRKLPLETVNAIDAIDWKAAIINMRNKYGYSFEQLGDLELETELLLCGLVSPESYPKILETRLKISRTAASELVSEMNELVFKKIREELIKNTERKKVFADKTIGGGNDIQVLDKAGIQIISNSPNSDLNKPASNILSTADRDAERTIETREDMLGKIEKPEFVTKVEKEIHPLLAEKLSGTLQQVPTVKTDHSLDNITKPAGASSYPPKTDPYRLAPD